MQYCYIKYTIFSFSIYPRQQCISILTAPESCVYTTTSYKGAAILCKKYSICGLFLNLHPVLYCNCKFISIKMIFLSTLFLCKNINFTLQTCSQGCTTMFFLSFFILICYTVDTVIFVGTNRGFGKVCTHFFRKFAIRYVVKFVVPLYPRKNIFFKSTVYERKDLYITNMLIPHSTNVLSHFNLLFIQI